MALRDVTHHALDEITIQAIAGMHPKLGKRFAPTTAELGEAVRDHMDFVQRQIDLASERLQIADKRPVMVKPMGCFERIEAARNRMKGEDRKLLFTVTGVDQLKTRRADLPDGFGYIALTGEVWGAPGSASIPDPAPAPEPAPAGEDIPW